LKAAGVWLEVTTLIVPGVNDDPAELQALAEFIYDDLGPETPWHLSRFYPQYKMTSQAPTEAKILLDTKAMGEEVGLDYIYLGNVAGSTPTRGTRPRWLGWTRKAAVLIVGQLWMGLGWPGKAPELNKPYTKP
jgi:hypothetical protein